ncbi:MAG: hypothetical protein ACOY3P_16175 [Planctomycetota bacterium]
MQQTRNIVGALTASLLVCATTLVAAEVKPLDQVLPKTTAAAVLVGNVELMIERFDATQVGRLMSDPAMEPFRDDLKRQAEERWSNLRQRLGLTLEDLRTVPGGEVAAVVIRPAPGEAAHAVVADITGKEEQARALLRSVTENLQKRGARRTEKAAAGTTIEVFELPKRDDEAVRIDAGSGDEANRADGQPAPGSATATEPRIAAYAVSGQLLVAADRTDIVEQILQRSVSGGESLVDHPGYAAVIERCQKDAGDETPQLRWFLDPLSYADVARTTTPPEQRRRGKSMVELLESQGFGAIQGLGGTVSLSPIEGFEFVHHTSVFAPQPHEKSMKMLVFPNGTDFTPQPWVPRDIATYTTFYFDIVNAFDNFGPLFDELFGQGEEGVWQEVVESMKIDPNGPQIDLREEFVKYLGPRVSVITDYQLPITTGSERMLFAIETKDAKAAAAGLEKVMRDDPSAKRRDVAGRVIWEIVEEEAEIPQVPVVALPGIGPSQPQPGEAAAEETADSHIFPHAAITVVGDQLLYASHLDYLLEILKGFDDGKVEPLKEDPSYRLVDMKIEQLNFPELCARSFSFTDEEYRATYELIRENKMPESETLLARLINSFSPAVKRGERRKVRVDGSKLPEFDVVRRSLGPGGTAAVSEPDGWFIKGFTLTKE